MDSDTRLWPILTRLDQKGSAVDSIGRKPTPAEQQGKVSGPPRKNQSDPYDQVDDLQPPSLTAGTELLRCPALGEILKSDPESHLLSWVRSSLDSLAA